MEVTATGNVWRWLHVALLLIALGVALGLRWKRCPDCPEAVARPVPENVLAFEKQEKQA